MCLSWSFVSLVSQRVSDMGVTVSGSPSLCSSVDPESCQRWLPSNGQLPQGPWRDVTPRRVLGEALTPQRGCCFPRAPAGQSPTWDGPTWGFESAPPPLCPPSCCSPCCFPASRSLFNARFFTIDLISGTIRFMAPASYEITQMLLLCFSPGQ